MKYRTPVIRPFMYGYWCGRPGHYGNFGLSPYEAYKNWVIYNKWSPQQIASLRLTG